MRSTLEAVAGAATYLALRAAVPTMVERLGLTRSLDWLGRSRAWHSFDALLSPVEKLADATPLVRRTCMYRSLSRYGVLRRAGRDVRFVMGVRRREDDRTDIDAHAWLEVDGIANDARAPDFVVTMRYPA